MAEILPDHTSQKVMVAFDHLRLYLKDFEWAYKYLPIFEELLSNEKDGQEEELKQDDSNNGKQKKQKSKKDKK